MYFNINALYISFLLYINNYSFLMGICKSNNLIKDEKKHLNIIYSYCKVRPYKIKQSI